MPFNRSDRRDDRRDDRSLPPISQIFNIPPQDSSLSLAPLQQHQSRHGRTSEHRHLGYRQDGSSASNSYANQGYGVSSHTASMPSHGIYTGRSVDRGHHQSSPAHPFDPRTTPIYAGQPSNSTSRYQQAVPYSGQSLHQAAMWTPEIGPGVYPSNSMMGHANPNSRDAAAYGRQDYHSSHHSMPPRSATPGPSSATNYRNLVLHEQEGHSDEGSSKARYECEYCGKGFLRPSALRIHIISHTGDKDFVCPEQGCGRRFGVRSNMLRHVRLVHQNINDEQDGRETRDWDDM